MRSSVEARLTDRLEKLLSDQGFLPLLDVQGGGAAFFAAVSCAKPNVYTRSEATTQSRLSCQLQYVLTTSRFVHYLKVISREHIGSHISRSQLERLLNQWITRYVGLDDQASPSVQARYPLREARVELVEHPEKPGFYRCVAFLRPQFQLDQLAHALRVITDVD